MSTDNSDTSLLNHPEFFMSNNDTTDAETPKPPAPTATAQTPGTGIERDIAWLLNFLGQNGGEKYLEELNRLALAARASITLAEENERLRKIADALRSALELVRDDDAMPPQDFRKVHPDVFAGAHTQMNIIDRVHLALDTAAAALAARSTGTERES